MMGPGYQLFVDHYNYICHKHNFLSLFDFIKISMQRREGSYQLAPSFHTERFFIIFIEPKSTFK